MANGLDPVLAEAWRSVVRVPSIEYELVGPSDGPGALPPSFRLEVVRPEHLPLLLEFEPGYRTKRRIGDFRDYDDFFQNGFGSMVIDEATGMVVSACMAHSVSRERVDHSLDTLPTYECRGFGYAVSYAATREGVRRGRRPTWITEIDNHGSRRIAERMGFRPRREYICFDESAS